jgi:hypothetical protein
MSLQGRLLGLEAPDIRTCLQLRDVLGVFVALITGAVGLGSLGDRRFVLSRLLPCLVQDLFFLQRVRDHRSLPRKVEVSSNGLLRGRAAAKGIVVECIVDLVELVSEAIVGFFKVNAVRSVSKAQSRHCAPRTHRRRLPLHCPVQQRRHAEQSLARLKSDRDLSGAMHQSRKTTWWGSARDWCCG